MRDAERMLETAIATAAGKVTEAEVASSLGVASRTTVLKLADAILREERGGSARARARACRAAAQTLNRWGAICSRRFEISRSRNFPPSDAQSPLDDIPDHEVTELKRLAAGAELTRHHAAVSSDGRFAGTDSSLAVPRPAARDGGGADGVAGGGDRRRRIAACDRLGSAAGARAPHPRRPVAARAAGGAAKPEPASKRAIQRCAAAARRGRSQGRCAASP